MEKLKEILAEQLPFVIGEWEDIIVKWNIEKSVSRGEYLSSEGQLARNLYIVRSGTLRIFYLHKDGSEICIGFAYPNTLICSYPSFISQKPSKYYIQAISPCTLVGINRVDFYRLIDKYSTMDKRWRMLTEQALLGKIEREVEMLTFTPEERYLRLFERSPHIFNLIPQKYLASYLGMQPETFSRIKAKIK